MHFIRRYAARNPLRIAVVILVVIGVLFLGPFMIFGTGDATNGTGIIGYDLPIGATIFEWGFVALIMGLVWIVGWFYETGLTSAQDKKGRTALYWIGAYPFVVTGIILFVLFTDSDPANYITPLTNIIMLNLAVAIFEETVFRGVLLYGLRSRFGPFQSLVISSVLFGLFHASNVLVGQALGYTMFQIVNAIALGIVLGAVYYQTNTLWAPIALHFLWNVMGMTNMLVFAVDPELSATTNTPPAIDETVITAGHWIYPVILAMIGLYTYLRWQRRVMSARASA